MAYELNALLLYQMDTFRKDCLGYLKNETSSNHQRLLIFQLCGPYSDAPDVQKVF